MANCKIQEDNAKDIVKRQISLAIETYSNKNYNTAKSLVEELNKNQFNGNRLIKFIPGQTRNSFEIVQNSDLKPFNKFIEEKIKYDDKKVEEADMQARIKELEAGNNLYIDMPKVTKPAYNEFSYENVLSQKMFLKEDLERQRDLLKNKVKTKEEIDQVEELNFLIRALYNDIYNLQKQEEELDAYLKSIEKDLENIKRLIKNPTLENIQAVNRYLQMIKLLVNNKEEGFVTESISNIEEKDSKVFAKLQAIVGQIGVLEDNLNGKTIDIIKSYIQVHIEAKEEYKDWEKEAIEEEVERLFNNQVSQANVKNNTLGRKVKNSVSHQMSKLGAKFSGLENQEEKNILMSILQKVYADAMYINNNKEKREKLYNIKDKLSKRLISLGHTLGKGFSKRADYSIFYRKSPTSHQLIGKYSQKWVDFAKKNKFTANKIGKFLYNINKTKEEILEIQKHFKNLKDNVTFIDVTRIPEIMEDLNFAEYGSSFSNISEAKAYRQELIDKIGEREYNKVVRQQIQNIHSYNIYKSQREGRLRQRYNLSPEQELLNNVPENVYNKHLEYLYAKSPFIFSENYRNKGNNIITKPYYIKGERVLAENLTADLEFVSFVPNKSEFFDSTFSDIQSDPVLNEAWEHMADLVEYNNANGYNENPNDLTEYSLGSIAKKAKDFPTRMIQLLSSKTLKSMHSALTTSRYLTPGDMVGVAGEIRNVDQQIEEIAAKIIKRFPEPTAKIKEEARIEAKKIVLENQEEDLVESILTVSEMAEKFKAKREIDYKMNFIKDFINNKTDRTNVKEIIEYFMEKNMYGINNRANFNLLGRTYNFSDTQAGKFSRFYSEHKKEVRQAAKDSIKELEKYLTEAKTIEEEAMIKKEISYLKEFLDSGGKVVTVGSILEAFLMKLPRVVAFSINGAAQFTNMTIATLNANEVDGRKDFWKAGVYHKVRYSFGSKRLLSSFNSKPKAKEARDIAELMLRRYGLFQNSGNEIFTMEKSRSRNAFDAILENPMNFVSETEKRIQRPQIIALMSELDVKGKNSTVKMFDAETMEFPAFHIDSKGNLALKEEFDTKENRETFIFNTSQRAADLFGEGGHIPKQIAFINGGYREIDTLLAEKEFATALALLFKKWAVMTVAKKLGTLKRLAKNDQKGLATSLIGFKAAAFGLATGFTWGPVVLVGGLLTYLYSQKKSAARQQISEENKLLETSIKSFKNAVANPITKGFQKNINLSLAIAAQSLGMIINPVTRKPFIDSDQIKDIMFKKDKEVEEFTAEEIREIKEDMYFLTTSIVATGKFLLMKAAVMMLLYPDEEEEEEYKKLVLEGEKTPWYGFEGKFFDRLATDPDTAMYYLLENTLSGFISDGNMMVNPDGLFRDGDVFNISRILRVAKSAVEGDYKTGPHEGESKFKIQLLRYITPAALKDGVSLGFGSRAKKDFDAKNLIDQFKIPLLEKVNDARLEARRKRKAELQESEVLEKMTEKEKKKFINKTLLEDFPVIKKKHVDDKGKLKPMYKNLYESYWN